MMRRATSIPVELISSSEEEDDLVTAIIHPRQINSSVQAVVPDLKLWVGPVHTGSWANMADCMRFISNHGCIVNRPFIWMQQTLNLISATVKPDQLDHILNGYADLYKLVLYFIPIRNHAPTKADDIRTFGGNSSKTIQQKRHRNLALILYQTDTSLFAPLYVKQSDSESQTCFATEDERIIDSIGNLLHQRNQKVTPRFVTMVDQNNDNDNDINDIEESQSADRLDVQTETALKTSTVTQPDVSHTSQTIGQPVSNCTHQDMMLTSEDSIANDGQLSSGTDIVEKVGQNLISITKALDRARLLSQALASRSTETVDRQSVTNEPLSEQELISQNLMMLMDQKKTRHAKEHVRRSNEHPSRIPVFLSANATEPANIADIQQNTGLAYTYDPLRITKQPKPYRRVRMLKDLAKKECPLVQAGEGNLQRVYIESEVPDVDGKELFIGITAVTENGHSHPYKTVAPENVGVDLTLMESNSNERSCLKYDPESFDSVLERVFVTISDKERKAHRKEIKVRLFNWKQYGPVTKGVIERENLRLCRLEFRLCMRLENGFYDLLSPPSYSSVIEDTDGDVMIDPTTIEPKQLCEFGGEKITVPLNVQCAKKGFRIECNGNTLTNKDFTMERKKLLLTSPAKDEQIDDLHLIINRTEYVKDSSNQEEKCLYDDYLPYVAHGQETHHCSRSTHNVANNLK